MVKHRHSRVPKTPAGITPFARALADMGYSGPVGMEAFARGDVDKALEAFRAAFTLSD